MLPVLAVILAITIVVLRMARDRRGARHARLQAEWDPLVLGVLAGAAEPWSLWGLIDPRDRLYFMEYLVCRVEKLHGTERELVQGLAEPYLPLIADVVQSARSATRRARTVHTLGELGPRRYLHVVIGALDDPSPLVAMTAAGALARKEPPRLRIWPSQWPRKRLKKRGAKRAPRRAAQPA